MRLSILALVLFTACGGSDADPHVVGACEGWSDNQGNPFMGMCEAACTSPPINTGLVCDTVVKLNCVAFEFGNSTGCCIQDGETIRFYECATTPMTPE